MKKLLTFSACCILLIACDDQELSPTVGADSRNANVSQLDIGPVNQLVWTSLQVPQMSNYPFNYPEYKNRIISVNGNVYCMTGSLREVVYKLNNTTKRWEFFADPHKMYMQFIGDFEYIWSHGSKFYYGFQMEYGYSRAVGGMDPVTGEKADVPDFPGTPVREFASVVIGDKGYILGGNVNGVAINQLWEYDFISKVWTNKGGLPGGARAGATAFAFNNKIYFGLGHDYITGGGQTVARYKNDWYAITPSSSGFGIVKADFPGSRRDYLNNFSINDKFYIGAGQSGDNFWEYNPANDRWTQKTDCTAASSGQNNINVFALGNAGYLVKGSLAEFWRYSNSSIVPVP